MQLLGPTLRFEGGDAASRDLFPNLRAAVILAAIKVQVGETEEVRRIMAD